MFQNNNSNMELSWEQRVKMTQVLCPGLYSSIDILSFFVAGGIVLWEQCSAGSQWPCWLIESDYRNEEHTNDVSHMSKLSHSNPKWASLELMKHHLRQVFPLSSQRTKVPIITKKSFSLMISTDFALQGTGCDRKHAAPQQMRQSQESGITAFLLSIWPCSVSLYCILHSKACFYRDWLWMELKPDGGKLEINAAGKHVRAKNLWWYGMI